MKILIDPVEEQSGNKEVFETMEQFRDWYCKTDRGGNFSRIPLSDFSCFLEGLSAITLCRRGNYQVELLLGQPGRWYESKLPEGQNCYFAYQGGQVIMRVNGSDGRDWNPDHYIQEYPVENPREDSSLWNGEGAHYQGQDEFQFSFGAQGGVLLAFSYRAAPYKSCLETVKIMEKSA